MTQQPYDVLVIGAGPAGYVCAIRAAQLGLKTAIVDKEWLGGVCLNVGCIPSKALLKNAELALTLRRHAKEYGIAFDNLRLDYAAAVKRSRRVSQRLTKGVAFLMRKNNITVHMGTARLTTRDTVEVTDAEGKTTTLQARNIVIATGAKPATIPGVEPDGQRVLTYREAILQDHLPKSAIIIGAGAIGVEFATIWNAYGAEVTIVEMLPHLLPLEDEEIGKELEKAFTKRGIRVLTGHKVEKVNPLKTKVKVTVSNEGVNSKCWRPSRPCLPSGSNPTAPTWAWKPWVCAWTDGEPLRSTTGWPPMSPGSGPSAMSPANSCWPMWARRRESSAPNTSPGWKPSP